MKKFFTIALLGLTLFSCKKNDKVKAEAEEIKLAVTVDRYDQAFFESKPQDLPKLKAQYPDFFPQGIDERFLMDKMQNPMWRQLYAEVQKRYSNFDLEKENLESIFKYLQFYFPKTQVPKVVTVIQDMDPEYKVIYSPQKKVLIISLELYLGKEHKFYEFPDFMKKTFEPAQMMPDVVDAIAFTKVKPPTDRDFLSQMIYAGKKLYLKEVLLPKVSDEDKMCYTTEELKWCEENDENMWRFMVEEKLLYDTNPMLVTKLIAPGPFSKFGLESDNQTPPRVATWIGWQIVKAYMDNNEVSVAELMTKDAKEIFQKSKYKPVKN
ncbi:gliding motility lipoprotein GldB [Flavobacterium sp.]|uniref:gliding motility lipoprotein GldB n=1 Tax=Flavobacterium sp. TaxID=239 RepID=UPI003D112BBF